MKSILGILALFFAVSVSQLHATEDRSFSAVWCQSNAVCIEWSGYPDQSTVFYETIKVGSGSSGSAIVHRSAFIKPLQPGDYVQINFRYEHEPMSFLRMPLYQQFIPEVAN